MSTVFANKAKTYNTDNFTGYFLNPGDTGERCFVSPNVPDIVWAKSFWTFNTTNQTVTIRTTFSKTFVDNTYGTSAIGWPSGHSFGNLTGSDKLGWSIKDANGVVKLAFEQDYISSGSGFPSGYGTLGFGGDGNSPTVGLASDVLAFNTSMDVNFNDYGYVLTTNSPATDALYTPNPSYPNWINDVWYEVTIKLSAFGAAGFGYPDIATVHASPSKTGNNTEVVNPTSCNASLGDYVWKDNNGNGIQDVGEPVFAGVTVTLTKPNGSTDTRVTDINGFYQFTNLSAGTYSVAFPTSLAGNFSLTSTNLGANDALDSDPSQGTGVVSGIVLYPGQILNTVDAGYVLSNLNLGDKIFYDNNRSGTFDAGDAPLAAASVNLYKDDNNDNIADGAAIRNTVTDNNGIYSFLNLAPGHYIVGVNLPPAYITSGGADPDNNVDNDNNGNTVTGTEARGNAITLVSGTEPTGGNTNNTYDIGIYNPNIPPVGGERCFVSPTVPAIVWAKSTWSTNTANQTVTIRTTFSKTFVDNTYGTSVIGWPGGHSFGNLTGSDKLGWSIKDANGVVKLAFEQDYISSGAGFPSGYGTLGFGGDGNNPTVGTTTDVVSFNTSMDVNFNDYGYVLTTNSPATDALYTPNPTYPNWINDVWYEVTVKLSVFGAAGFGYPDVATVHASPSKTGNNTEIVNPTSCIASLGDYVWKDNNGNGIQDGGEPVFAGVTVTLTKPDGSTDTRVTDVNGFYQFTNLSAGTYSVAFPPTLPGGFGLTSNNQGANDALDSDPLQGTGVASGVILYPGQNNATVDAGYVLANLTLGNRVFYDVNRSGLYDAGDGIFANVPVKLYKDDNNDNIADGGALQSTTTNVNGLYTFSNLAPGNYIVGAAIPSPYAITVINGGDPDNNTDEDNNAVNNVNGEARGMSISLASGTEPTGGNTNNTYDIGFYNPTLPPDGGQGCYTGTNPVVYAKSYWNVNQNSQTVTMRVTFAKTFVDNTYGTNAIGWPSGHTFGNLTGSDHLQWSVKDANGVVKLNFKQDYISADPTQASGYGTLGFGGDGGTPTIGLATDILSFRTSMDANFNDYGYVLTTNSPVTDTSYTADPLYPNWIYEVWYEITVKASMFGAAGFGSIDVASVHASPSKTGNNTEIVTSVPCSELNLGNFVWYDINNNGTQDVNEPGIGAATVKLYKDANQDNIPDGAAIATTTTNGSGLYGFSGLAAGNYIVGVVIPAGYTAATPPVSGINPNNNDNTDNNGITTVGGELRSNYITLTVAGEPTTDGDGNNGNLTMDFGLIGTGSIGDRVWLDANNNGIQDGSESGGISGVTVQLKNAAGTVIATTTTNSAGNYLFSNLPPGNYTVVFPTTTGVNSLTIQNAGSDDNIDSDGNPATGETPVIILGVGQAITNVDAGYRPCPGAPTAAGATICLGSSATLTATGVANASFAWYSAATGGTLLSNLATYTTPALNANATYYVEQSIPGCSASSRTAVTVTVSAPPASGINGPATICAGEGALFVATNAGVGSVYNWTFASGTPATATGSSATSTWSIPGEYAITLTVVKDGCSVSYNRTIIITQEVFAAAGPDAEICSGSSTTIVGNGPSGANYSWTVVAGDPTSIDNGGSQSSVLVSPLVTTTYRLTVTQNGCTRTDDITVVINVNRNPVANAGPNKTTCIGVPVVIGGNPTGTPPITNPTAALGYSWLPTTGLNSNIIANPTVTLSTPGVYTYQVIVYTLATGCSDTSLVTVTVEQCLGSIGNRVWLDENKNGLQDPGETGVSGVTLSLYNNAGTIIATTITDGLGNYKFNNVPVNAGGINYQVSYTVPAQYVFTGNNMNGLGITDDNNSDPNTISGRTGDITLTSANPNIVYADAGLFYASPNRIGDFIWNDLNRNGIQDAGEPGIAGVTVSLYNSAGLAVRTTITDNNGYYKFDDVMPGTYTLGLTQPVGYTVTLQDAGPDLSDNDFIQSTSRTAPFVVTATTNDLSFDGGLIEDATTKASVGDKVWNDVNGNNLQDADETGVPGVTVQLFAPGNILVASTTTDAFGNYIFNNLNPGTYYIKFSNLPAGYSLVTPAIGTDRSVDSDVNNVNGTGTTSFFSLNADQNRTDIDAGIRNTNIANLGSIGDKVWYDLNKNGIQDPGEAGVPGVTVSLFNATTNALISTTITNATGLYLFNDLANGNYTVGFSAIPAGYDFTSPNATVDDADSDVDPNTNRTGSYTINTAVPATKDIRTVDAGIVSTPNNQNSKGSIGDRVWNDINNNGQQDVGEPGVAGLMVTLYSGPGTDGIWGNSDDLVYATTTTDGLGNYIFTNLPAGSYQVGFSKPPGYNYGIPNTGNDNTDSDADITTGRSQVLSLLTGEVNLTIDAGITAITPKSTLGDRVWFDLNSNGVQDSGEPGVKGVSVTLYDTNGNVLKSAATDANGLYLFTDLNAGNYIVGFANYPGGYTPTGKDLGGNDNNDSDADPVTGKTAAIILGSNTSDLTVDLGIITTTKAAVGDYVWFDANGNGIQDGTELPAGGITVTLYNNSNVAVATTVTDANGNYLFTNLAPGTYTIGFSNLPENASFATKDAVGSNAQNNSDVNPGTGRTDPFVLTGGQLNKDVDAGLVSNFAAVGNYVWFDVNGDGVQNDGDVNGVAGMTVILKDNLGNVVASAVTDGKGYYFINNIPVPVAGASYFISFTGKPTGSNFTVQNSILGNSDNTSDANTITGSTGLFTLVPGQIRLDIDAGLTKPASLPVNLISFNGSLSGTIAKLNWVATNEINLSHYELERSIDGSNFISITSVAARGNINGQEVYNYNDNISQLAVKKIYYRLKIVDQNGVVKYSNIVIVRLGSIQINNVYPIPFSDYVNVEIETKASVTATVRFFDGNGKQVLINLISLQAGGNQFTINGLGGLARGHYIIEVTAGTEKLVQKLNKN
jgi:protocatechuate 3,4-dioxygenase beta subunit